MARKMAPESRRTEKIQLTVTPAQLEAWLDYADDHGYTGRLVDFMRVTVDAAVGFKQPSVRIQKQLAIDESPQSDESPF